LCAPASETRIDYYLNNTPHAPHAISPETLVFKEPLKPPLRADLTMAHVYRLNN
jgi:hypothetical protein